MKWKPALFEASIIDMMLSQQFHDYVEKVKKTDCQAALRRLLVAGPPVYIFDKNALSLAENTDKYVCKLWYARKPEEEVSAKLIGALEGKEREKLWKELEQFIIIDGKEEDDKDANERSKERAV